MNEKLSQSENANLYEAVGGREGCHKLAVAFYSRVARDPILRPLFPSKTFTCAIEEFAAFLAQFLGGPNDDMQRRWWLSLRESHHRFKIGQRERDAWIANMAAALDVVELDESRRKQLLGFFERSSAYIVNQGEAPELENSRGKHDTNEEISRRWAAQTVVDRAVAAIRIGDTKRAIALAEDASVTALGQPAILGLIVLMLHRGQSDMLDYVRTKLIGDPTLVGIPGRHGRSLLHEAAASGCLTIVELLLSLGADPNASDGGGHTPLYCAGNESTGQAGGNVVRVLAKAGANVNADDGVKRCTALHMAARRGNGEVAEALLDCGADIEARDRLGETPLRRAVNCSKVEVAALLLARGADRHSIGSKGLTPLLAARSAAMKNLLQTAPVA